MTARTVKIIEGVPDSYPPIGSGSPPPYDTDLQEAVWQRVESWIAWRFAPRDVVFLIEGPGHWDSPLRPFTVDTVEKWNGLDYVETTARAAPIAAFDLDHGTYRITGEAGLDLDGPEDLPAVVAEACDRLAGYFQGLRAAKGINVAASRIASGELALTMGRDWAAQALQRSGAADLLRPYRNLGALQ